MVVCCRINAGHSDRYRTAGRLLVSFGYRDGLSVCDDLNHTAVVERTAVATMVLLDRCPVREAKNSVGKTKNKETYPHRPTAKMQQQAVALCAKLANIIRSVVLRTSVHYSCFRRHIGLPYWAGSSLCTHLNPDSNSAFFDYEYPSGQFPAKSLLII